MAVLLIILKILIYLLLLIIGLVLLLLLIPVSYRGKVATAEDFRAEVAVGWAWRLLGISAQMEEGATEVTLRLFDRRILRLKGSNRQVDGEKAGTAQKEEKKDKKQKKGFSIKYIANKALVEEIIDYFKRVLGIIKPKYMHLYGTYGFEDPSVTGMLAGMTGLIESIVPHARIALAPDFTREVLELDMCAEGSLTAGSLVYQTVRTLFRRPVRKIWFKRNKN